MTPLTPDIRHATPLQREYHERFKAARNRMRAYERIEMLPKCRTVVAVPGHEPIPVKPDYGPLTIQIERSLKAIAEKRVERKLGPTPREVKNAVCERYSLSFEEMIGPRRDVKLSLPRQIAVYLVSVLCPIISLPRVGKEFGNRDHTTVMHAIKKIKRMIDANPVFADEVAALSNTIRAVSP